MSSFKDITDIVCERHGDWAQIEKKLVAPKPTKYIEKITDDRWLSTMSKCIFQSGFNWSLIEEKWPRFEEVFHQFNIAHIAMLSDEDMENSMEKKGIVKNYVKIKSIRENAYFIQKISSQYSSAGKYFSTWKIESYADNLQFLQKNTCRLGGKTGQLFLRNMGVDTVVFTPDVVNAMTRLNILEGKPPSSIKTWSRLQKNLHQWHQETGLSLNKISQLLALSID